MAHLRRILTIRDVLGSVTDMSKCIRLKPSEVPYKHLDKLVFDQGSFHLDILSESNSGEW